MGIRALDPLFFEGKGRLLGVLLAAWLVGVLLISLALYRSAHELEILNAVESMSRLAPGLLGGEAMRRLHHEAPPAHGDHTPRFYAPTPRGVAPLRTASLRDYVLLQNVDLDATRVNERGGFVRAEDRILAWAGFSDPDSGRLLVLVDSFQSSSDALLFHVYIERMIVPVLFSLWLMVWVALMLNHLLRRVKEQQEEITEMALRDALTGLPNRGALDARLPQMVEPGTDAQRGFALALIDLDGFKAVNERYGHASGDELLRQVAMRIRAGLRGVDTCARLGGDEFVLLMSNVDAAICEAALAHLHAGLTQPYALFDRVVSIGVSIGVAMHPQHGEDSATLLRNADRAMCAVKARGGGVKVFEPGAERAGAAATDVRS